MFNAFVWIISVLNIALGFVIAAGAQEVNADAKSSIAIGIALAAIAGSRS